MFEAEWLTCTDPTPMLEFLRGKASDRKLRLFACATAAQVATERGDNATQERIDAVERSADGGNLDDCRWAFGEITSPIVGTFYGQSDPTKPPFVTIGSVVRPDNRVGIIEAM